MQVSNHEVNKRLEIPCTNKTFYRLWLSFLIPVHKFTPQVILIASELLRHRQELSAKILDEIFLTKELMGKDVREQIMKDCDVTLSTYRVTINKLKKGGFFKDGMINPRFIPHIDNPESFNMLLMFKIKDEQKNI